MRYYIFLILLSFCIVFAGCEAPDDSENGAITIFNLSKKDTTAENNTDVIYRVKTKGVGGYLAKVFNDKNDLQLSAAQAIGIDPVESLRDAYYLEKPLKRIATCDDFVLDSLTHSMPYLVPKAAQLLHDIGKAFCDTVLSRSGHKCQMIVTSVLRTDNTVNKLRRHNINATSTSCHRYGTTFDISWTRFNYCDPDYIMYTEDLKNILAEVLFVLRKQGRCYVKYERKQSCFHITAR